VAVLDSAGNLVMEAILEKKASTILKFIHGLRGSLQVTFEEGTCAAWLTIGRETMMKGFLQSPYLLPHFAPTILHLVLDRVLFPDLNSRTLGASESPASRRETPEGQDENQA